MLREANVIEELDNEHPILSSYIRELSPTDLTKLLPAHGMAFHFHDLLKEGEPFTGMFTHFPMLQGQLPQHATWIARLAYHVSDVASMEKIHILQVLATDPAAAAQLFLPGMEDHPLRATFDLEPKRWLVCTCDQLIFVGDCGHPTPQTVCWTCKKSLGLDAWNAFTGHHSQRDGVRHATLQDFPPPKGWCPPQIPFKEATPWSRSVRGQDPAVIHTALLLNAAALMSAALKSNDSEVNSFVHTILTAELDGRQDRCSFFLVLSRNILYHLAALTKLLFNSKLRIPDQFRFGHLLLHKLINYHHASLKVRAEHFAHDDHARERYEHVIAELLNSEKENLVRDLVRDLQTVANLEVWKKVEHEMGFTLVLVRGAEVKLAVTVIKSP